MILQVISTSPQDSKAIEQAGAHRIELVSALQIGGLTPSISIIRKSLQASSLPTNVIIRHHNNGFHYPFFQKQLLIEDIIRCKEMKANGVVIGCLNSDSSVDQQFLSKVCQEVGGKMSITFHKASDQTPNIFDCMSILSKHQIQTVLTQGGITPITKNYETLTKLLNINNGVNVLLGGGINLDNISQIMEKLNPKQIHVGTCVRTNKYGGIERELVEKLLNLIKF